MLVLFIINHIISRVVLGFSSFTVLSLVSITSLTLLSRTVHVALASFTPSLPSLWMFFGVQCICTFLSTEVLCVRVPGGCRSNVCHGYCRGSLVAPFRFTRHFPHGFNLIFIEGIKKSRAFLPKATKKSA